MKTTILSLIISAASLLGLAVPAANAASIPASYTLTDLGPDNGSNDGLGTSFLHASDGQTFTFSWTYNRLSEASIANLLNPTLAYLDSSSNGTSPSSSGGQPYEFDGAFMNRQGVVVANVDSGSDETIVSTTRGANGSFGPPNFVWASGTSNILVVSGSG